MYCPECSGEVRKNGIRTVKYPEDRFGNCETRKIQQYQCKACGRITIWPKTKVLA